MGFVYITFTFIHLADTFIQIDFSTVEKYNKRFIIKRQISPGSARNTKLQVLFRLLQARHRVFFWMQSNVNERD